MVESTDSSQSQKTSPAVSRRALIIAFVLLPINVWLIVRGHYAGAGIYGIGPIFQNAVAVIFGLALLNLWLKRRLPKLALRTGELLTVYAITTLTNGLVGGVYSVGGLLPAVMTYPFWYGTTENKWLELLCPYFPTWLIIRDKGVLEGFWAGESNPYHWVVIKAWGVPTLWWASFMGAIFWTSLCFNSIVRRRWEDEEKLPFPFVAVPVQVADERFGLFRSKVLWIGFGIAFCIGAWNSLPALIPGIPTIPLSFDFYSIFVNRYAWAPAVLWSFGAVMWTPTSFGLCFLIPQDLLFSLFAFGLLLIAIEVFFFSLGLSVAGTGFPYSGYQTAGGLVGLVLAFMWLDRRYLIQVLRRALGLKSVLADERQEAFSYRTALFGGLAGLAYCWWFWARAGIPGWIMGVFLTLYVFLMMFTSRVRAQVGSPIHELAGIPDTIMRAALGTFTLGPRIQAMFTLMTPYLLWDQENAPSPTQLETLKMAEGGRMERRRIAIAMAVATPLVIIFSFWAYVHFGYHLGIGTAKSHPVQGVVASGVIGIMDSAVRAPTEMNVSASLAVLFGAVLTPVLLFLKLRFPWWPLHPIAFPICHTWYMHYFTLAIIVTWVVKTVLLRYGGLRAHRAAMPFFLGLLVGDLSAGFLRSLIILAFSSRML